MNNYAEILEKTNNQLSLSYAPMNTAIAILAVLFGLLTIAATIIFFRQSKDYKEIVKGIADKHISEHQKILEEITKRQDELIKGIEEFHHAETASAKKKKLDDVEDKIGKLAMDLVAYAGDERMQKARTLLLETSMSISDISIRSGYKNLSNFSAAFKRKFGYPPEALRR
jgi:AraC-like DNA-binding protein